MTITKRFKSMALTAVFSIGALAGALVLPAGVAEASGECNTHGHSGYVQIDQYYMWAETGNYRQGTLELYWSNYEGKNCAIARGYGVTYNDYEWRTAGIRVHNGTWDTDTGYFNYYAGPVYTANSRGKCVDLYGEFRTADRVYLLAKREINNVHCG